MIKDELFKNNRYHKKKFEFGENVANCFDDMIARSVPFYEEIQRIIEEIVEMNISNASFVYDIGCATGSSLLRLLENKKLWDSKARLVGVDASRAMLKQAKAKLSDHITSGRCELIVQDINKGVDVCNASVVILNLTLQFIKPCRRELVLSQIYKGLNKNGCLILVEKTCAPDKKIDKIFQDFFYKYKLRNGYSVAEIKNKKVALKDVLVPKTYFENVEMLRNSGFKRTEEFFRWYNFSGIIAIKN